MSASLELVFDLSQLRPHPFRDGLALAPETTGLRLAAHVREAEEVERFGFPDTPGRPPPSGVPTELDEPGFVGMQFQPELREPLAKISKEPLRILLILKPRDEVVRETHDNHIPM